MAGKFWLIWAPGSTGPTVPHPTLDAAVREAKRLARANLDTEFYVLEAVAVALKTDVEFRVLRSPADAGPRDGDDIPF